jgi:V-type H+-transporting ATPase subunit E
MQLNASRIKVLQAQDDVVNSMKESAGKELLRVSDDTNAYKKLLTALIVQVNLPFDCLVALK